MVITNDHYQSTGKLSVNNQGAFNVSRVSDRSALIFVGVFSDFVLFAYFHTTFRYKW